MDQPQPAERKSFNAEHMELIQHFRPAIVSFHFGLPEKNIVKEIQKLGSFVVSSATTLEEAQWLEENGVDAIIAQGSEAGGHRGMFLTSDVATQVGTFALLPQVVKCTNVPIIAAGGICDRATVLAARLLGADAVQVGTAYLLCPESRTSKLYREALKSPRARETVLTNVFTGRPARAIVNRFVEEKGPISTDSPEFPLAADASFPLRKEAESLGITDFSNFWSGQNASGCRELSASLMTKELLNYAQQKL
jgi:nitronate monooxygenase